jgi:hypothetical protein
MLIRNILKNNVAELLQQNFGIEIDVNYERPEKQYRRIVATEFWK